MNGKIKQSKAMKDMCEMEKKNHSSCLTIFLLEYKYFFNALKNYMAVTFLLAFIGYFSLCIWNGAGFFNSVLHGLEVSLTGVLCANILYCISSFICILIDKFEQKRN